MMKKPMENGFTYKFVRINPKDVDYLNLNYLIEKYQAYCGYGTFDNNTSGNKKHLKGFIVFPIRLPLGHLCRALPNFLIDFVKTFDKIETRFKNLTTTVWRNQHPLNTIRVNLLDKFNNAE